MEVHHHSHESHGKKNWRTYAWEFLMLFLAVFCGFLAEYKLEHTMEHQREKQYVQSLIADLKGDQEVLSQHILLVKNGVSMMESLITLLNSPAQIPGNTGQLYYWARLAPRLRPLAINDRTFEQLKNSGNFRLIRNLNVSNEIMAYYEMIPLEHLLESINESEFTEYKRVASKIFSSSVFLKMEGPNDQISQTNENPPLRSMDNELLQELSVFAAYLHGTKKGVIANSERLKAAGVELIEYLQKEYNIK